MGITSLFVASKFEEIYCPDLKDFVFVCDNAYTKDEILEMEGRILKELNFNLTCQTPYNYFLYDSQHIQHKKNLLYFAMYLLELCSIEYKMLKFRPSVQS